MPLVAQTAPSSPQWTFSQVRSGDSDPFGVRPSTKPPARPWGPGSIDSWVRFFSQTEWWVSNRSYCFPATAFTRTVQGGHTLSLFSLKILHCFSLSSGHSCCRGDIWCQLNFHYFTKFTLFFLLCYSAWMHILSLSLDMLCGRVFCSSLELGMPDLFFYYYYWLCK